MSTSNPFDLITPKGDHFELDLKRLCNEVEFVTTNMFFHKISFRLSLGTSDDNGNFPLMLSPVREEERPVENINSYYLYTTDPIDYWDDWSVVKNLDGIILQGLIRFGRHIELPLQFDTVYRFNGADNTYAVKIVNNGTVYMFTKIPPNRVNSEVPREYPMDWEVVEGPK